MRSIILTLPALLACSSDSDKAVQHTPGDDLPAAIQPGQPISLSLSTWDGAAVTVPDPGGRYVVLELIRSADW
jgi:hypothetical protein